MSPSISWRATSLACLFALAACGGSPGSTGSSPQVPTGSETVPTPAPAPDPGAASAPAPAPAPGSVAGASYSVRVNVSGLDGTGLRVRNNGGDELAIASGGVSTFATAVQDGGAYAVSVSAQPVGLQQTCTATGAAGTVSGGTVTVDITCVAARSRFAYIGNYNAASVAGYSVDAATGALTSLGTTTTVSSPWRVAVNAAGTYMYVGGQTPMVMGPFGPTPGTGLLQAFSIDATTGALTQVAAPTSLSQFVRSIATTPSGRYVYTVLSGSIVAHAVDLATGALTAVPGSPFTANGNGNAAAVDPSGKYLLTADSGQNRVYVHAIDQATGALTQVWQESLDAAAWEPVGFVFDPQGRFAYVGSNGGARVSAFTLDGTTGALAAIAAPYPTGAYSTAIAMHPRGRFVYVGAHSGANITVFAVDPSTGALAQVGAPVATAAGVAAMKVDARGGFLHVVTQNDGTISRYAIDPVAGTLTLVGTPAVTNVQSGSFNFATY